MQKLTPTIDISNLPEVLRLAEEVQATGEPRVLTRGDQQVALLSPVNPAELPPAALTEQDDSCAATDNVFGNIIGIARSGGPTDVAENKHKYLAEAYLPPEMR
jgi:hypothetical protein